MLRDTAVQIGSGLVSAPGVAVIDGDSLDSDEKRFQEIQRQITRVESLVNEQSFAIMRWNTPTGSKIRWAGVCDTCGIVWDAVCRNFFGWFAMTLLVGLGAPFWYDLLKTVVGVKDRLRSRGGGGAEDGTSVPPAANASRPPASEPPALG